jgi:DNA adenine methylase
MTPSGAESQSLGVHAWYISKRLVNLRYSASYDKEHRGERQELLLTTLPPSRVPTNDRFRLLPSGVTCIGEGKDDREVQSNA